MIKILRRIVTIEQDKYKDYNLDDSFLDRPLDLLVGIKHCKVETLPIPGPEAYLHPHLCLMAPSVGKVLSFQGTIGQTEFSHPICTRKKLLYITQEESDKISREGVSTRDVEVSKSAMLEPLFSHVLESHQSDESWINFMLLVEESCGMKFFA